MLDYVLSFKFNSLLGILLYWVPLSFCVAGYTARTARNYVKDRKTREEADAYYIPTDTIGDLVGRAIVSCVPVANMWAALFDLAPEFFGRFFRWWEGVLKAPLVPDSEAAKRRRRDFTMRPS